MAKNEVTTAKSGELTAGAYDYGDASHDGFGNVGINDLSIPFLNLLQSNSPEVEEQTMPGAIAGAILNSVSKEIMAVPLVFQPFHREEVWVEWKPRNQGGGVMARYEPTDKLVLDIIAANGGSRIPPQGEDKKRIPFKTPNGGELVETYYVTGLILDEEGQTVEGYGVIAFSSTKIKVQKDWLSAMYTVKGRPPLYAHRAKISTVREKREGGNFFNFSIAPFAGTWRESLIDPNTEWGNNLLSEAKNMREMVDSGLAKHDVASLNTSGDDVPEVTGKDAPF